MVFSDIYPDGHQTGVSIIQHGLRVAANGDLRLEASPGQWSPVPKGVSLNVDKDRQIISQRLSYPDESKNRKGFNPIEYPDLQLSYTVNVQALGGNTVKVSVDLDRAIPAEWVGKIGFNLELFPEHLFGKSWIMDENQGIFPLQANGPVTQYQDEWLGESLAQGRSLTIAPENDLQRIKIENKNGDLQLLDGRLNHNNGWFIVRSLIPANSSKNAIEWYITANTVEGWQYKPVIQVSQLGYGSEQPKKVIIEQDKTDNKATDINIYKLSSAGRKKVFSAEATYWGKFLRYNYFYADFSHISEPGMYVVEYRGEETHAFRIGDDVFSRHAWQPTLEYYLPVQMCHMRVVQKYRVWHGLCHEDDALMSPVNTNHFDGYISGPSTLTEYDPMEAVPGLNKGGWHDAGDYDLRVESQIKTVWLLSKMVEEFNLNYDATTIDQARKHVEIHQPDGKNDALQQIDHGLLTVLGGYKSLGRLYRGIIVPTIPQYVHLGDAATQTDNKRYDKNDPNSIADDRWVFTEENPDRELLVAAGLATASRVMSSYDKKLSKYALKVATALYKDAGGKGNTENEIFALAELLATTQNKKYAEALLAQKSAIIKNISKVGWALYPALPLIKNEAFIKDIDQAVKDYQLTVSQQSKETPYGVPYRPHIWGAGWQIQEFAVKQYLFHKAWPQHADINIVLNAANFILGVHPGENTISFASGVGANSAEVAYGVNRADWSHIPGGVISGTALIRPDLPELKTWPFFWQQTEYVMGGGATNYMFLILALDQRYNSEK